MHIKQEPGLLGHIKQEPGTPHSFHGDPFYEPSVMPFPSKPINFNFMADIEDIVRPTNSGKPNRLWSVPCVFKTVSFV